MPGAVYKKINLIGTYYQITGLRRVVEPCLNNVTCIDMYKSRSQVLSSNFSGELFHSVHKCSQKYYIINIIIIIVILYSKNNHL